MFFHFTVIYLYFVLNFRDSVCVCFLRYVIKFDCEYEPDSNKCSHCGKVNSSEDMCVCQYLSLGKCNGKYEHELTDAMDLYRSYPPQLRWKFDPATDLDATARDKLPISRGKGKNVEVYRI